jgi:hypothetical protein
MKLSQREKLLKVIDRELATRSELLKVCGDNEQFYFKGCIDMLNFIKNLIQLVNQEQWEA